jgi:hypothetical protein
MAVTMTINEEVRGYLLGSVDIQWRTDAPDQLRIKAYRPIFDEDLPIVDQKIQIYLSTGKRIFSGPIYEIGREGLYQGSQELLLPIKAVGMNVRLYQRTTRHHYTGVLASYRSYDATVNTDGTTVTWTAGTRFNVDLESKTVTIAGVEYVVASVQDPLHLTLATSAGTQSGANLIYNCYSGDIAKDLIDTYMVGEGYEYTEDSIAQGAIVVEKIWDPPVLVAEALDELLELNPTFSYWVDYGHGEIDNWFHFRPREAVVAPIAFTDASGAYRRDLGLISTAEDVRNVELSVLNPTTLVPTLDEITFDGAAKAWFTSRPVGTMIRVYLGSAENPLLMDVGEENSNSDFFYKKGTRMFWQEPLDPVRAVEDGPCFIEYYPLGDNIQQCIDSAAVASRQAIGGGSGRRELVIDRTASPGQVEAYNEAAGSIERYKDDLQKIRAVTWEPGLRPGQLVTFQTAKLGINGEYYIEALSAKDSGVEGTSHDLLYSIDSISSSRRVTASDVFRGFGGKGKGPQSISGASPLRPGGPFKRALALKDTTVGNDVADHVSIYATGNGKRITGVLRVAITEDLVVRINKLGEGDPVSWTITIPQTTEVNTRVVLDVTGPFVDGETLTFDVLASDGQKVAAGVASFTVEWV